MIDKKEIYYNSYFGFHEVVGGIGNIYPILVPNYKRFLELFNKYMLYSLKSLYNMGKIESIENMTLFNFITASCVITERYIEDQILIANNDEEVNNKIKQLNKFGYKITEVEELLSIITRKTIKYDSSSDVFIIIGDIEGNQINKDNFDKLRDIVMLQNVIYEPLIFKSKLAQKEFEKELKRREKDSKPVDFLSMLILVDMNTNGDVNTYTYYKLAACYEVLNKKIIGDYIQRIRAQGVDQPLINLGEELNINSNPYDKSNFFKSHKMNTTL